MAITLEYVGETGGGSVESETITTGGQLSGNNTRHVLTTIIVPEGETWLVILGMRLTDRVTATSNNVSNYPHFFVGTELTGVLSGHNWRPSMRVTLTSGTYEIGIQTDSTSSSYRVNGTGTLYTVSV